ncbi:unnamed protein product [Lactuca virosa]|uniref:Uncharacterized protein n=1 Tax=Lactuca virosa TaxID=75947 RepID=A0AAU9MCV3_9ASTR|nr:unnamed protein product [Lactuca virosa]
MPHRICHLVQTMTQPHPKTENALERDESPNTGSFPHVCFLFFLYKILSEQQRFLLRTICHHVQPFLVLNYL